MNAPLILLLILAALQLAAASFVVENVAGTYNLSIGKPNCPKSLTFSRSSTSIPPATITVDGESCTGAILDLISPSKGDIVAEIFLTTTDIGQFLRGEFDAPLICGGEEKISANSELNFVSPDDDVTVDLEDILGFDTGGAFGSNDSSITLRKNTAYVTEGVNCVYTRPITEDEKDDFDVVDAVTECFPASAKVVLEGGETVTMDRVKVGDRVLVAPGVFSNVFGWTHRDESAKSARYVSIGLKNENLVLTEGHFVYANGKATLAGQVRVGDLMTDANGDDVKVISISDVDGVGLYNPQTLHGDIIVDGVTCTTYTIAVQPMIAHSLLAPLRAVYNIGSRLLFGVAS